MRSFEDCEIAVAELKTVMFKSLNAWIAMFNSPHFFVLLNYWTSLLFPPTWGSLSYTFYVLGLCLSLCFLMGLIYL